MRAFGFGGNDLRREDSNSPHEFRRHDFHRRRLVLQRLDDLFDASKAFFVVIAFDHGRTNIHACELVRLFTFAQGSVERCTLPDQCRATPGTATSCEIPLGLDILSRPLAVWVGTNQEVKA